MKPSFKNNFMNESDATLDFNQIDMIEYMKQWELHIQYHKDNATGCLTSTNHQPEFMSCITTILRAMNISFLESCGEGEAQCAWLQINGYVDFIWTNDSDTLIFGGTKLLKNYSKSLDDVGMTSTKASPSKSRSPSRSPSKSPSRSPTRIPQQETTGGLSREYFVTEVDLNRISLETEGRLGRWPLLFFSILSGADYNQGVKGLGKAKAMKLAQLSNPNFALRFRDIFASLETDVSERTLKYAEFQQDVFHYCQDHSKSLFGRNYSSMLSTNGFEDWPTDLVVLHYFHPFTAGTLNHSIFNSNHSNVSGNLGYDLIKFNELGDYLKTFNLPGVTHFDKWFHETMHQSFLLHFILYSKSSFDSILKITEEKELLINNEARFKRPYWKIRYKAFLSNISPPIEPIQSPTKQTRSPSKRQTDIRNFPFSMWLPKEMIPRTHVLVKNYEKEEQDRLNEELAKESKLKSKSRSPRKKNKYVQKNNLDVFLQKHASPIKDVSSLSELKNPVLEPVKRKLFVEDNDDSDNGHPEIINLDESFHDDSLIVLEENNSANPVIHNSPTKRLLEVDKDDVIDRNTDIEESPLKRTHRDDLPEKKTLQLSFREDYSTDQFTNRPVLKNTVTFERTPSVLDQLVSDAQKTMQDDFDTSDSSLEL